MNPATIVEVLLSNLWPLLPFRVVRSDEWGVRWTWGKNPKPLASGFHWCWYVVHSFERMSNGEGMYNLPTQSVVTADDYAVCYSANIGARIVDPVAYYCEVDNFTEALEALAMTHLAKQVRRRKYAQVVRELDKLELSLRATLTTQCHTWGVKITRLGFTDFVHVSQQVRLFQDTASGGVL